MARFSSALSNAAMIIDWSGTRSCSTGSTSVCRGPDAIAAPRVSQRNTPTNVAEPGFISQYGSELQSRFGQLFTPTPEIGAATGIEVLPNGTLQAAAEPVRRGGGAAAVVCPADHPLPASPRAVCAPVPAG